MSAKAFVDTNILIYAIERDGPELAKAERARTLLRSESVCLSTQVLGEFYAAVTNARRVRPLAHDEAIAWIQVWKLHDVRDVSIRHVDLALELCARAHINYYDALILATARLAGCVEVYSEDLNPGQDYGGVRVRNPFVV